MCTPYFALASLASCDAASYNAACMGILESARHFLRQIFSETSEAPVDVVPSPSNTTMMECPRCGRCEDADVRVCPSDGSAMRASTTAPRWVNGKYHIEWLIGHGGMGSVYRARDRLLGRPVAIKVIRAELMRDPAAQARFQQEAQTLARLQHPSIVDVFDYGLLEGGSPYLVMELIRGDDLRHELAREGRVEPDRGVRILSAVCAAMEAAHREGIFHCDLKPENILLPDDGVEAKVLDFGVARAISWQAPRPPGARVREAGGDAVGLLDPNIAGTPAYMAPEQLRGETPDARSDVFSLGVIAYEMLTGALPFGGGSIAEVRLAQSRGVRSGDLEGLAPPLSRAILAAIALDPDRRPPSPEAFAHLIGAAGGM